MSDGPPSNWTKVVRAPARAVYEQEAIREIVDAVPMCNVAFTASGRPAVIPTLHWREGDDLYIHGSSASRALRAAEGAMICVAISTFDGLVLARSAFHHSVNYRSVVIYGRRKGCPTRRKPPRSRRWSRSLRRAGGISFGR